MPKRISGEKLPDIKQETQKKKTESPSLKHIIEVTARILRDHNPFAKPEKKK
jgi:hypothetical protein